MKKKDSPNQGKGEWNFLRPWKFLGRLGEKWFAPGASLGSEKTKTQREERRTSPEVSETEPSLVVHDQALPSLQLADKGGDWELE